MTDQNYNAYYSNDQAKFNPSAPPPYSSSYPSQQPQTQPQPNFNHREERFREIITRHEISQFFANKLQVLSTFKIVFIFDDSGSMNSQIEDSPLNTGLIKATRWDELKYFSRISLDIASIFNENGTDIHFLNRPPARNITHVDQLSGVFNIKPAGYTPLGRVLQLALNENSNVFLGENKLLVIIVTDGEPTDEHGRNAVYEFQRILQSRHKNVYTTIVSCTDDDESMSYLNSWDKSIPRLDVVDDFRNERAQIVRAQGPHFRFSFGDYIVKSLVGSIDHELDKLDERNYVDNNDCCALI
jgi:hypothetical protein